MIRVCCTIGTWQLITLVASLQQSAQEARMRGEDTTYQDYLIVYETGGVPDTFKQILHEMATAIWPWKRIVWAYDLLTSERRFTQREFARRCRSLHEELGLAPDAPQEIWTCWLTRPAEKVVFAAFPRASLVLYEDGLISYIPVPLAQQLLPDGKPLHARLLLHAWDVWERFQPVSRFRRSRWELDPRHLPRLSRAYRILAPDAPPPDTLAQVAHHTVRLDLLRDALNRAAPAVPSLAPTGLGGDNPLVLILGQALSRNGILPRDEELTLYQEVIDRVLRSGYRVLWKEHPRISVPFFAELKASAADPNRVADWVLPHAFPVELAVAQLPLAACVAGTSAALFYLRQLYGIPCYTFADTLLPRMQGVDVFMGEMVRREALPLSALPVTAGTTQ